MKRVQGPYINIIDKRDDHKSSPPLASSTKKKDVGKEHASLVIGDVVVLLGPTGLLATKGRRAAGGEESVEGGVEEVTC